ncbi:MAG: hypothetical protein PHV74_10530 [Dehalococcoidia bacterium]|nr:hypothetical protein [Dehalococcoidia bacterium]
MNYTHHDGRNPSIQLHIEELVLHGFPAMDRDRIARSVEQELTRLLQQEGIPAGWQQGAAIPSIDAGDFTMGRGATPEGIGRQISRNLYGGMKG